MNDEINKPERPSLDKFYLAMAEMVSERSTCLHRHQGAVLVQDGRVIGTGYNGSPPEQPHCTDLNECSKEKYNTCRAEGLHGESNALLTAARLGIRTRGSVIYTVYSPCRTCCNMLRVAGIVGIVYKELYPAFIDGPNYLMELGLWYRTTSA